MIFARQSTAIIVTVGPVLDAAGVAVTDGVVGDFKISKNGAAPAALNASATLTHRHTGHYSLSLTATDVNTVGTAEVVIDDTVNACPMKEIQVVEPAVYDALFADAATGMLPANVIQWLGVAPLALSSQQVQAVVPITQKVDVETIKTRAVTAVGAVVVGGFVGQGTAALAVDGTGHIVLQDGSLTTAKLGAFALAKTTNITGFNDLSAAQVNAEVDTALNDAKAAYVAAIEAEIADDATGAAVKQAIVDKLIENLPDLDDLTLAAIAAAVRDVNNAAPAANSLGAAVNARATQVSVDDLPTNAELATALGTADDAILAQIALVKTKTDNLPLAPAAVSDIPSASAIATSVLTLANGVEPGWTLQESMCIILSAVAGLSNSHELNTPKYRDMADSKDRISATVDINGNRTAVVRDPS